MVQGQVRFQVSQFAPSQFPGGGFGATGAGGMTIPFGLGPNGMPWPFGFVSGAYPLPPGPVPIPGQNGRIIDVSWPPTPVRPNATFLITTRFSYMGAGTGTYKIKLNFPTIGVVSESPPVQVAQYATGTILSTVVLPATVTANQPIPGSVELLHITDPANPTAGVLEDSRPVDLSRPSGFPGPFPGPTPGCMFERLEVTRTTNGLHPIIVVKGGNLTPGEQVVLTLKVRIGGQVGIPIPYPVPYPRPRKPKFSPFPPGFPFHNKGPSSLKSAIKSNELFRRLNIHAKARGLAAYAYPAQVSVNGRQMNIGQNAAAAASNRIQQIINQRGGGKGVAQSAVNNVNFGGGPSYPVPPTYPVPVPPSPYPYPVPPYIPPGPIPPGNVKSATATVTVMPDGQFSHSFQLVTFPRGTPLVGTINATATISQKSCFKHFSV